MRLSFRAIAVSALTLITLSTLATAAEVRVLSVGSTQIAAKAIAAEFGERERLSGRGSCCAYGLGNGLAEECLVPPCARLRAKTRGEPYELYFPAVIKVPSLPPASSLELYCRHVVAGVSAESARS